MTFDQFPWKELFLSAVCKISGLTKCLSVVQWVGFFRTEDMPFKMTLGRQGKPVGIYLELYNFLQCNCI